MMELRYPSRAVPEFALSRLRLHTKTWREMRESVKALLDARPIRGWDALEEGKTYYVQHRYHDDGAYAVTVRRFTASRRQAIWVVFGREPEETRVHRGDYATRDFAELDQDLISLLGVTHEAMVVEALRLGLGAEIPGWVRVQYARHFVRVPDDFALPGASAAERLESAVDKSGRAWDDRPLTGWMVRRIVAEAHDRATGYADYLAETRVRAPSLVESAQRFVDDHLGTVEFYTWLLPHIEPGGALYVEGSEAIPEDPPLPPRPEPRRKPPAFDLE